jgi:hypothetical protein
MTTGHGFSRALAGALALAAAGCTGSSEFDVRRTFQLQGAGAVSASEGVNLADLADEAWDQRDHVNDVTIESAVATIIAVGAANTAPSAAVVGAVSRGSGAALERAEVMNGSAPIQAGARVEGQDLDAAGELLQRALESDGRLSVEIEGSVPEGTTADFTVEVVMRVNAEWSLW